MTKRIDQFFEELSIRQCIPFSLLLSEHGPTFLFSSTNTAIRPTMPTSAVCQVFDDIRSEILLLLDLKKNVDKRELDIKVLEGRKAELEKALREQGKL